MKEKNGSLVCGETLGLVCVGHIINVWYRGFKRYDVGGAPVKVKEYCTRK